jgi:large subunit ribosomal protein L24
VQTTLLGLAIAAILALVAALVGPAFVDWGKYRVNFEAEAARIAGQPVRIGGAIDVRILPTPTIVLHDVEIGPRAAPAFGAQAVRVELALDGLMRGELRAAALALTGPEIAVALDANGQIVTHLRSLGFDPDRIAIDRLAVADGRVVLEDAASGARMVLDKLAFAGEVRSQTGQVKGDGTFTVAGQAFRYQVATGRRDVGTRLKLNLEPADRPLAFETEGTLTFENDAPKFEGTASLARPAGVVLASGKTVASEPWRILGRVRADTGTALFEQVETLYGPDERRVRLGGTAEFKFGARPRFDGVLSAHQIDLDRAMAAAGAASRVAPAALAGILDLAGDIGRPPFPVSLGVGVDSVTLGGATLQSVRADIKSADGAWNVNTFEFRAPGATHVRLSGRVGGAPGAAEFSGPVAIDSNDPGVLMAWLEGADRPRNTLGALRLRSDVTVSQQCVALERVTADIDRKALEGRLVYTYPVGAQRARIDVAVKAAELDVESAYAFATTLLAGSKIERPGDIALAVDLGRATFAGFTATSTNANLRFDASGLRIGRLAIADFGGSALTASGQIDIASAQPHGSIALNLAAPKLDGVAAVLEKFLPGSGDGLTRNAARLTPVRIDASLTLDPQQGSGGGAAAKLSLNGQLGNMRLTVSGDGTGNISALDKTELRLDVRAVSDDGALVTVLGLDPFTPMPTQRRPATLNIAAGGPISGELRIDARLAGEGFDLASAGTLKLADPALTGALITWLSSADLRGLRRPGAAAFPVSLKSNVKIAGNALHFTALDGKAGGAAVQGQLSLARNPAAAAATVATQSSGQAWDIDGKLAVDTLDVPALLGSILGAPLAVASAPQTVSWPSQPFAATMFTDLRGRVEIDAARAAVLPAITAQKLHGVIGFGASQISLDHLTASIGGGNATAQANFERGAGGLSLRGRATLANSDATAVIRAGAQAPVTGRLGGELAFESIGTSPAALIAGLRGAGSIALDNGKIAGLDPRAIETVLRAVERGTTIAPPRISEIVTRALDAGSLSVVSASAPIEMTNGRVRLSKVVTPNASDAALVLSLDLVEEALDARFTLLGSATADTQGLRPELIVLYKGPLAAPRRSIDVTALTSWLTLQSVERESKKLEVEEREAKRRESLEALIRETAREREIVREPVTAPPVTGTTPPAPAANAANAPGAAARAPAPTTGLFAPVLPAPQFIPNSSPSPAAALTAPVLPSPIVVPSVAPPLSAAPTTTAPARTVPAVTAIAPATAANEPDDIAPNLGALPLNPPLPPRRPSASAAAPVELAPVTRPAPRPGFGTILQHNAPQ